MSIELRLKREGTGNSLYENYSGWRMRVTAVDAVDITDKIFVYERRQFGSGTQDVFVAVASPEDINTYPEDAPAAAGFFRLNFVDLIFRSTQFMEDAWEVIQADVQELVLLMKDYSQINSEIVVIT